MTEDRPLGREIRWPAVGVLTAFVVAGALMRDPPEPGLCVIGGVVAVSAASLLCARGARTAVALAILAGAGVGLVAGSHDESLAWFGLCVLAFWVVVTAGSFRFRSHRLGGSRGSVGVGAVIFLFRPPAGV